MNRTILISSNLPHIVFNYTLEIDEIVPMEKVEKKILKINKKIFALIKGFNKKWNAN